MGVIVLCKLPAWLGRKGGCNCVVQVAGVAGEKGWV